MERVKSLDHLKSALNDPGRTVLIDFDHTLFGSNSTEQFLAQCRPTFAVSILLATIRESWVWKYASAGKWARVRDYLAVLASVLLTPWNLFLWSKRAPRLFEQHENRALATLLESVPHTRIIIITFGINPIVRAMIAKSKWHDCRCVAVPLFASPRALFRGKLAMIATHVPAQDLNEAVFVTDSENDSDLLNRVGFPALIDRVGPEMSTEELTYFPLRYTRMAKYPAHYVTDQFIFVDLVILLLATQPMPHVSLQIFCTAVLAWLSLICVYEIGYFENDMHAATREAAPVVTSRVARFRSLPLPRDAWIWGIALGLLAVSASVGIQAAPPDGWTAFALGTGVWGAVLIAVRILFWVYNRTGVVHRIFLYPFLQFLKTFGPLVLLRSQPWGVALLLAQVMTMWMNYAVYRRGGSVAHFPRDGIRLAAFVMLLTGLAFSGMLNAQDPHISAILIIGCWCTWRAMPVRARQTFMQPARHLAHVLVSVAGRSVSIRR